MRKTYPLLRSLAQCFAQDTHNTRTFHSSFAAAAAVPASMGQADVANGHANSSFPLSADNINPKVKEAQYAVRGEIVARAKEIEADLKNGKKLPFEQVIYCNIGNPQQLGQVPITFFRQVLAICDYPNVSLLYKLHSKKALKASSRMTILEETVGGRFFFSIHGSHMMLSPT